MTASRRDRFVERPGRRNTIRSGHLVASVVRLHNDPIRYQRRRWPHGNVSGGAGQAGTLQQRQALADGPLDSATKRVALKVRLKRVHRHGAACPCTTGDACLRPLTGDPPHAPSTQQNKSKDWGYGAWRSQGSYRTTTRRKSWRGDERQTQAERRRWHAGARLF